MSPRLSGNTYALVAKPTSRLSYLLRFGEGLFWLVIAALWVADAFKLTPSPWGPLVAYGLTVLGSAHPVSVLFRRLNTPEAPFTPPKPGGLFGNSVIDRNRRAEGLAERRRQELQAWAFAPLWALMMAGAAFRFVTLALRLIGGAGH